MKSNERNDMLAQSLGRLPRTGHMQGLGKLVTPIKYFHTVHAHNKHAIETELYA